MPGTAEQVEVGDELWFGTPPGWIELAAHDGDEAAIAWFDRLLAQTPDAFDDRTLADLRARFLQARGAVPRDGITSAGVLVTTTEADEITAWQFTLAVVDMPPSGDVNVMAVIERYLESDEGRRPLGADDFVETFQTDDGRDGVAVHTTADSEQPAEILASLPTADPGRLGVVHAAVRLNRPRSADHDRVLVLTAVCPRPYERLALAVVAASVVLSARLRDGDAAPLPGRVDLDATGAGRDR